MNVAESGLSHQAVNFAEWAAGIWQKVSVPDDPEDFASMKLQGKLSALFMARGTVEARRNVVEVTEDSLLLQVLADPLQRDRCASLTRPQLVACIDRLLAKLGRIKSLGPQDLGAPELDRKVVEGVRLLFVDELTRLRAELEAR